MSTTSHRLYHRHEHDPRAMLETYFSDHPPDMAFKDDALTVPMKKLHAILKQGHIGGKLLMDFSAGSHIHHLFFTCKYFQEIILMRTNEPCIMEIMKWLNDHSGAFRWEHATQHAIEIDGSGDESEANELKLKSTISKVMKFDTETESLADLTGVQTADCIMTTWFMDMICQNQDDYTRNMKKMLTLLKPGGYLFLIGATNGSYYTLGDQKYHIFKYDENLVKNTLVAEGMTILQCEDIPRKSQSQLTDFQGVLFVTACKQK
ncbi:indolethylamine N-methyltransferase-like [Hyperolius riggenbachi]|uniref:indolethylamine N-methyltransferase-like n=1 Tax=Hyperolius riggenbachi TaxID=752182 RepID=UPI0035A32439